VLVDCVGVANATAIAARMKDLLSVAHKYVCVCVCATRHTKRERESQNIIVRMVLREDKEREGEREREGMRERER